MAKFERDEIERRLKEALAIAYQDVAYDDEIDVEVDGPFAVLVQYSLETNEPVARFEIRFDIEEVS
jgi:hypothetical protein